MGGWQASAGQQTNSEGFHMNQRPLSRRNILVAGAAASATAAGLAALGTGSAVGASDAENSQNPAETVGNFLRLDVLTATAAGEQVLFVPASAMSPNGKAPGTTSVFSERGFYPANAGV